MDSIFLSISNYLSYDIVDILDPFDSAVCTTEGMGVGVTTTAMLPPTTGEHTTSNLTEPPLTTSNITQPPRTTTNITKEDEQYTSPEPQQDVTTSVAETTTPILAVPIIPLPDGDSDITDLGGISLPDGDSDIPDLGGISLPDGWDQSNIPSQDSNTSVIDGDVLSDILGDLLGGVDLQIESDFIWTGSLDSTDMKDFANFIRDFKLTWDVWVPWTSCTRTCGGGNRARLIICSDTAGSCSQELQTPSILIGKSQGTSCYTVFPVSSIM